MMCTVSLYCWCVLFSFLVLCIPGSSAQVTVVDQNSLINRTLADLQVHHVAAPRLRRSLQPTTNSWWTTFSTTPSRFVVSLGDSYTSGLGLHRWNWSYDDLRGATAQIGSRLFRFNRGGGNCYREFDTVPGGRLAQTFGIPHVQLACAGAETPQARVQFDYLNAKYPRQRAEQWEGSTIVLSVGGNDLRNHDGEDWPNVLVECILELMISTGCEDYFSNNMSNLDTIEDRLANLYGHIASQARRARIRVLGYPRLMQPTNPFVGCHVIGVSFDEARWIDTQVDRLNEHIVAALRRTKWRYPYVDIAFVDVQDYITRGSCQEQDQEIQSVVTRLGFIPTSNSFHPNQAGYDAYFDALWDSL